MTAPQPHPILIVEDNDYDFRQAQRAFQESRLANPLYRCTDGDDALDFLHHRGEYGDPASSPRPGIILLDLNLRARTNGREVLVDVKSDPELKTIPVVMLTTSLDERDIQSCYAAGANSYICKPVTFEGYLDAIRRLEEYWFHIVVLPPDAQEPRTK
jgi:CheY-like chemotaxis protein